MASSASELAALLPRELSALPLLGTGALSEVRLLARPNGLPPLALKATRKPLLAFTQQIDRLVAEHRVLQATCAAECPSSLARFVGALHDAERVYLFSEAVLAHGTQSVDLRQLLDARARLPPATRSLPGAAVARIADGLFGALRHLHGRRFAHRDVKPDNLVISTDGGAVLIDLGHSAALPTDGVSRLRSLVGTEAYMAPELLARRWTRRRRRGRRLRRRRWMRRQTSYGSATTNGGGFHSSRSARYSRWSVETRMCTDDR